MEKELPAKERIIQAARHLFAKKGFKGTTTAEIAANAHISEGTIYRHFNSKEELLMECIRPVFQFMLDSVDEEIFKNSKNLEELTYKGFEFRLYYFEKYYETFRIFFNELPYSNEIKNQYIKFLSNQEKQLHQIFSQVKEMGEIKRSRNYLLFAMGQFMSLWLYINFKDWLRDKDKEINFSEEMLNISEEHILEDMTNFFIYGISGVPESNNEGDN